MRFDEPLHGFGHDFESVATHGSVPMYSGSSAVRFNLLAQTVDRDTKVVHLIAAIGLRQTARVRDAERLAGRAASDTEAGPVPSE